MDHDALLEELPHNMRTDILLHIHVTPMPSLQHISLFSLYQSTKIGDTYLFSRCDRLFIRALVTNLSFQTYAPGETILYEGDVADHMYYLKSGKVKVMPPPIPIAVAMHFLYPQVMRGSDGVVFDVLSDGEIFGETEFFDTHLRPATVQVWRTESTDREMD